MMLHLSKNRDVSVVLARTEIIPSVLVNVMNLARHPENAEQHLVYNLKGLVPTLLFKMKLDNSSNPNDDNRQYAATGKLIHTPNKLERLRTNLGGGCESCEVCEV
eukprot:scaffold14401_cov58-Cyclotella_meneghiniana.AAC.14